MVFNSHLWSSQPLVEWVMRPQFFYKRLASMLALKVRATLQHCHDRAGYGVDSPHCSDQL